MKKFGGSGGRVAGDFVQNHKILNFFWVTRTGSAFYKILEQKYFITIFFYFFYVSVYILFLFFYKMLHFYIDFFYFFKFFVWLRFLLFFFYFLTYFALCVYFYKCKQILFFTNVNSFYILTFVSVLFSFLFFTIQTVKIHCYNSI